MNVNKIIQLAATAALLVPLAAEGCEPSQQGDKKGGDKEVRVRAGQTIKVYPGWRWKQEKAVKGCTWQLLLDKNENQYIELGAGKKKFGWIKIVAITDPKYKGNQQYIKSNKDCGWWVGQKK
jgi:hypothetical protein